MQTQFQMKLNPCIVFAFFVFAAYQTPAEEPATVLEIKVISHQPE